MREMWLASAVVHLQYLIHLSIKSVLSHVWVWHCCVCGIVVKYTVQPSGTSQLDITQTQVCHYGSVQRKRERKWEREREMGCEWWVIRGSGHEKMELISEWENWWEVEKCDAGDKEGRNNTKLSRSLSHTHILMPI